MIADRTVHFAQFTSVMRQTKYLPVNNLALKGIFSTVFQSKNLFMTELDRPLGVKYDESSLLCEAENFRVEGILTGCLSTKRGSTMLIVLVSGILIGAVLILRLNFIILVPVTCAALVITGVGGA